MMALPYHEPADVYAISPLIQAIRDALDRLLPKERYCIDAIYAERITYDELGARLGYKPQLKGSPQAYMLTKMALTHLKDDLMDNPVILDYLGER